MGTWKRGLLDWPVRALRRAGVAGRCDCWRIKVVELELVDSLSHETVRQTLKKRPEAVAEGDVVHPPPPPPPTSRTGPLWHAWNSYGSSIRNLTTRASRLCINLSAKTKNVL